MVQMALGQGRPATRLEKIKNLFFGKTSIGSIVLNEAMKEDPMTTEQQTDDILSDDNKDAIEALKSMGITIN